MRNWDKVLRTSPISKALYALNKMDVLSEKDRKHRKELFEKVNKLRKEYGEAPIPYVEDPELIYCSFCGKVPSEIESMIQGIGVFICNECIVMSKELIDEVSNNAE